MHARTKWMNLTYIKHIVFTMGVFGCVSDTCLNIVLSCRGHMYNLTKQKPGQMLVSEIK